MNPIARSRGLSGMGGAGTLGAVLALSLAAIAAPPKGPATAPVKPAPPRVIVLAGEYSLLRLQIEGGEMLFVPFRDGKGRVAHPIGINREGGWLERKGMSITGTFEVRDSAPIGRGRMPRLAAAALEVAIKDRAVTGEVTLNGKAHRVTGTWLTEAELAAANPLAAGKSWPAWTGPAGGGTSAEPTGVALVDSLAKARLLWRSEEAIGNSMGSVNRFMQNLVSAMGLRTSGQSASPVLGEGKVFMHQRVPAGTEFSLKSVHYGASGTTMEEVKAAGFEEIPWYAMEKYLLQADEQVIAMDARTGKSLWKTVLPMRAPNIQYHKDRGGDRTPVYADGKLLGLTYHGGLFCLDAATGAVLWENAPAGKAFNPALAAAAGVVLAPARGAWAGFDIQTGKELWRAPGHYLSTTAAVWAHEGKHYFLIPTNEALATSKTRKVTLHCIEARGGAAVWTMPLAMGSGRLGLAVAGNHMVAFETLDPSDTEGKEDADKTRTGQVCGYQLSLQGARRLWGVPIDLHDYAQPIILSQRFAVAFGHHNSKSEQQHKVIDLAGGKVLSSIRGPGPSNGGYVQAMEDLVLVRRDGTHGRIEISAYGVDAEGKIRLLEPELWSPPGPHTTSYHHPFMYPLVDGRMYVRQADGIYCYDLRAGARAATEP